jgi:hypothetical protein
MASLTEVVVEHAHLVWTGWRLGGGVRMMLMSRAAMRLNCSVRGMGVAVSVSVSTFTRRARSFSLAVHAEFLLFVHDQQAEVFEFASLLSRACVPMTMSIWPGLFLKISFSPARFGSG